MHADDTTMPILAKGKTDTGRIWTYLRDYRPLSGADPPGGALLRFARQAAGASLRAPRCFGAASSSPTPTGGYNGLHNPVRKAEAVASALGWAHARRGFFEIADIADRLGRGEAHQ